MNNIRVITQKWHPCIQLCTKDIASSQSEAEIRYGMDSTKTLLGRIVGMCHCCHVNNTNTIVSTIGKVIILIFDKKQKRFHIDTINQTNYFWHTAIEH